MTLFAGAVLNLDPLYRVRARRAWRRFASRDWVLHSGTGGNAPRDAHHPGREGLDHSPQENYGARTRPNHVLHDALRMGICRGPALSQRDLPIGGILLNVRDIGWRHSDTLAHRAARVVLARDVHNADELSCQTSLLQQVWRRVHRLSRHAAGNGIRGDAIRRDEAPNLHGGVAGRAHVLRAGKRARAPPKPTRACEPQLTRAAFSRPRR